MNKAELIECVSKLTNLSDSSASNAIEAALDAIIQTLAQGGHVNLAGFGTFTVRERPAKTMRNPHTGEVLKIRSAKIASFRAAKPFKEIVQDSEIN